VKHLDRYRTFCLLLIELLPVLGMLVTVLGLMYIFEDFGGD
jgi:biopolymer transport protein ExbB/TolQ